MSDAANPKPTTEERYALATSAGTGLVLRPLDKGGNGPLEHVIAAGAVATARRRRLLRRREGDPAALTGSDEVLAPLLHRLASEWDSVRSEQGLALKREAQLREQIESKTRELARLLAHKPVPGDALDHAIAVRDAKDALDMMRKHAAEELLTQHLLMLSKLRTLPQAREALFCWARIQADRFALQGKVPGPGAPHAGKLRDPVTKIWRDPTPAEIGQWMRESFAGSDDKVRAITGHVLRAFLDPLCKACFGTKQVFQALRPGRKQRHAQEEGRYGLHHLADCGACKGTGLADQALGETDEQRRFARHLLDRMKVLLEAVARDMRRYLHSSQPQD